MAGAAGGDGHGACHRCREGDGHFFLYGWKGTFTMECAAGRLGDPANGYDADGSGEQPCTAGGQGIAGIIENID